MTDLSSFPNRLDGRAYECRAIIETPKGRRNKFKYDTESGLFTLSHLLPEGMYFPFDFGFVPSTLSDDGDPLDVLVLMDEPAHVGCLLDVRIIGVIEARQTAEGKAEDNHRLLGVALASQSHSGLRNISALEKRQLDQIEQFFISYNQLRGRKFQVKGRGGPQRALAILREGIRTFEARRGGSDHPPSGGQEKARPKGRR
jgi:inorganic pyrophosphatase